MMEFFRYPHTPHLACLGAYVPRDDKVLSPAEVRDLLSQDVVVEEKLDGANLGISVDPDGNIQVQNRGQYLVPPFSGQFSRLQVWVSQHGEALVPALGDALILFGEWCAARHSIYYNHLPDWFIAFDIYDRHAGQFWSTVRRDTFVEGLGFTVVPPLTRRRVTLPELMDITKTSTSRFGEAPLEGVIVRHENTKFLEQRAKLVRADFAQTITEHWRSRPIEWNRLATA